MTKTRKYRFQVTYFHEGAPACLVARFVTFDQAMYACAATTRRYGAHVQACVKVL